MKTFNEWLAAKGVSEADFATKSAEEQAGMYNEYNDGLRVKLNELETSNSANKSEVDSLKSEIAKIRDEQMESLKAALKEQGATLVRLKEGQESSVNMKSLKESLSEHKETLKNMAQGSRGGSISVKAPADMSIAANVTGEVPQAERLPGLNTVASREVKFLSLLNAGTISSNLISWVYQANKDGAADQTAEGIAKNQIDFDLLVGSQRVEKTTAYIKVTTEMLDDIDFIESEIRNELNREMLKKVEQQAYAGTGVSPELNGVSTVATAFTGGSAAGTVDSANEFDVLVAAALQIKEADQPMPNAIFVAPGIMYKIKHLKVTATDRRYVEYNSMITMEGGEVFIDGIRVVESTLPGADDFLVGYFPYANIYTKEGMNITIGLDSDDFTKNFRTILAEWRGVVFVKNNDRTAFVTGDFTTAKAALETGE